jgi:hypothetical protein
VVHFTVNNSLLDDNCGKVIGNDSTCYWELATSRRIEVTPGNGVFCGSVTIARSHRNKATAGRSVSGEVRPEGNCENLWIRRVSLVGSLWNGSLIEFELRSG